MSDDTWLIAVVGGVWTLLAVLYATVPMLDMPGSVTIWGGGAALFLALAAVVGAVERKAARRGPPPG